jgi:hypothetical protein
MINKSPNTTPTSRGHYSLIQFCPDAARLEVANIGVALFCAEQDFFGVRLSNEQRRITQMFGRGDRDLARLRTSREALEERLLDSKRAIRNIEDLDKLASLQVNQIRMTKFMPCRVTPAPNEDLSRLFDELVGTTLSPPSKDKKLFPTLESLFARLESEGRAELNYSTKLPVFGQEFKVPFAYRNGVLNLVKPKSFSQKAPQHALDLAIRGDLINKHGVEDATSPRLVVVSKFRPDCDPDFISHVDEVFKEYRVKHVRQSEIDQFANLVESEAHA